MRIISSLGLLASLVFFTGEAKPCGGAFGSNYTIQPAQNIVVSFHDGVETYVMNPNFCGQADSFGLILPIPSALQTNPKLGTQQLYTDLAAVAAPTTVTTQECSRGVGGGASAGTGRGTTPNGTTVIQRGQVGIFDYALLKANSVTSFTDWLEANGFPNQAAASTFQAYVDQGWYFVAFKVSAGASSSGTAGAGGSTSTRTTASSAKGGGSGTTSSTSTICGSFGPIALSFPVVSAPVIPARIATVSSSSFQWDIYAVGSQQMQLQNASASLRFSGALGQAELTKYPALAEVAKVGDRLTELLLTTTPTSDLILESNPNPADYRRTQTVINYVTCSAGATGIPTTGGSGGTGPVGGGGQATGGLPDQGGKPGSGGDPSTGGTVATGGQLTAGGTLATGGTLTTGGSLGRGGQIANGGKLANGGNVATGGAAITKTGGTSASATAPAATEHDDDGGCSIAVGAVGSLPRRFAGATLLAALILFGRGRRHRRRTDQRRS